MLSKALAPVVKIPDLLDAIDEETRPALDNRYNYYYDSDRNRLDRYSIGATYWAGNQKLGLDYRHTDATDPTRRNRAEDLSAKLYSRVTDAVGAGAAGLVSAALAAGLLSFTVTQIWFARYPTSEALTLLLMFTGLYGLARYARTREAWAAVLAGVALGEVMLVRIDTYFLLGVPLVLAAHLRLQGYKCDAPTS